MKTGPQIHAKAMSYDELCRLEEEKAWAQLERNRINAAASRERKREAARLAAERDEALARATGRLQ